MISVIVPVYNAATYLIECIGSILNQSFKDIELILVNDGSSDNSLDICRSYEDKRVRVIDKKNGGVSSARNSGIDSAQGEYLMFVDSDDTLPLDAIQILHNRIITDRADMAIGSFMFQYSHKYQPHSSRMREGIYDFKTLLPDFIDDGTLSGFLVGSVCGAIYKSDIIKQNSLHFNVSIKNNEDGLFNFEYALKANRLSVTEECVYYYRQYGSSSSSKRELTYDFNAMIKSYISELVGGNEIYNLSIQFKRRSVSLALWDILKYPQDMGIAEGIKFIRNCLNEKEIKEGLKYINRAKISKYKKIFYNLMKCRLALPIYLIVTYVIPRLNSVIVR